jgi:hypothetical protein
MPNKMTVKELKELLQKFDENAIVEINGGNSEPSMFDWAELNVDGEIIMEL